MHENKSHYLNTFYDLGMDFLDVKKEICNELKQVDKRIQESFHRRR